ncbi:helix-turn-helix domain-containing protein [Actinomadura syzygii]|uniref:Helix-turn-helix transcriptional regulator n=1 Tax=Actinomadura syzygii TaxID=1427538 RepID=A0A5D0TSK3_9ACTN|nr:helix-turn-helix transcriptional regulator [Actinomadura syzygii]TYC08713.1 helix-turn-helix transcriptional regulator [Actinomadura syzygii]
MARWSDYTTGERIKILRGPGLTQERLAEAAGLSVATIRKAERDLGVGLPSLLRISAALHTDVSVVLGQQEPRRAMRRDDRAMLRELSRAVHDTAAGVGTDVEPEPGAAGGLAAAWDRYRSGQFATAGALAAIAIWHNAAAQRAAPDGRQAAMFVVMTDAYRLASYVANQFGARDLAYAAIGHAAEQADLAGDDVRAAMVASGRSWIYLRDARLDQASATAERSYRMIEPRYGDRDLPLLATYGWHVTFAAVVAARDGNIALADDLLSQGHAVAARMGRDVSVNGTAFGPATVQAQAVGIQVSTGRPAKALETYAAIGDQSVLTPAARNRLMLDVALAQCDTKRFDDSLDTLLEVCTAHPDWARHQALPDVIARRAGRANTTTSRYRKLAAILGTSQAIR